MLNMESDWFPSACEEQTTMFANIEGKIVNYQNILNLTNGQVEKIIIICKTFITINNYVDQSNVTAKNLKDWQNLILNGTPKGAIPPQAPSFQPLTLPDGAFVGIIEEFRELVRIIKAAKFYKESVGADLMILDRAKKVTAENRLFPTIKVQCLLGGKIHLEGSLSGMPAMRVEYRHKFAENWQTVAFLTQLPAEVGISPNKDEPRSGQLRAILMKNNAEVGQFSLNYPISLS